MNLLSANPAQSRLQDQGSAPQRPLRVVSVPSGHPYVVHLHDSRVVAVCAPEQAAHGWIPPAEFEPQWITEHASGFDIYHLHFGTEGYSVPHLHSVVDALRTAGRPLVYTVHDLSNPQLLDQSHHHQQLNVLIPAADALITLTPGAAKVVQQRWQRAATVIAHPQVVPLDVEHPKTSPRETPTIGIHLKDLRPNIDALGTLQKLVDALAILSGRGLAINARIDLNTQVRDAAVRDRIRELCAGSDNLVLCEHQRLSDSDLFAALDSVDIALLPYSFGSHSGWVEMCWDLGIPVVGPEVGFYAEQHGAADFYHQFDLGSGSSSMADAIANAVLAGQKSDRSTLRATRRGERQNQQRSIAEQHLSLYQNVCDLCTDLPGFDRSGIQS